MKLETYLRKKNLKDAQFGELIGVSQSQVSRLKSGVSYPSWKTVEAIERATNGKVTARDFVKPQAEERAQA